MTLLSEIPLFDLIFAAEEKHGEDTHMVIEAVPKNEDVNADMNNVSVEDVVWWVEFQDQVKTFDTFDQVEKFFLEEAVAKFEDLVVK
jgi:hypothetical protein